MQENEQLEILENEIDIILEPLSSYTDQYNLVKETINQGKTEPSIDQLNDKFWSLLSIKVYESISGSYKKAVPLAAALYLLKIAAEVFDDIEDADSFNSISNRYGNAVAANLATTLIFLAEKEVTRLKKKEIADNSIITIMDKINSFYTTACIGQHLDLSLNTDNIISEDTYLEIIGMKSASQVECSCYTGALLATENKELINTFAKFGHNLGMAVQITNDIQGINHGSDIIRQKITLPLIYALTQTNSGMYNRLKKMYKQASISNTDLNNIKDLLYRSGAVHYAIIKNEFYKQQALHALSEAEYNGANIEILKIFLL